MGSLMKIAFVFVQLMSTFNAHNSVHPNSSSRVTASTISTGLHSKTRVATNPRQMLYRLAVSYNAPEQVHISFGSHPTNIIIMWSSSSSEKSFVEYGNNPQTISRALATNTELKEHSENSKKFIHRVELENLSPGTHYTYRIISGSSEVKSKVFSVNIPHNNPEKSHTFIVVADMGLLTKSLQFLVQEALNNRYDAVFHVGDIAYNLGSQGGSFGDQFMNRIQKFSSIVPYMTVPGDHEGAFDFYQYRHRFSSPGASWPMKEEDLWYSIDIGHAHIIGINSLAVQNGTKLRNEQLDWLRQDLVKANRNRHLFPWIIVMGHKPLYCTKSTNKLDCDNDNSKTRAALEDLFFEYGVDLHISGHKHCYERSWPVYKSHSFQTNTIQPTAPIYIVIGTMGYSYRFHMQMSAPKWLAASVTEKGLELFARLSIANSTHLTWSEHITTNNKKVDEMNIIQHKHGSFGIPGQKALDRLKKKIQLKNEISSVLLENSVLPSKFNSFYDPMNRNLVLFVGIVSFSFLVFLLVRYSRIQCFR